LRFQDPLANTFAVQHNYVKFKGVFASEFRLENSTIGSHLCNRWQLNSVRDVKGYLHLQHVFMMWCLVQHRNKSSVITQNTKYNTITD